MKKKILFLGRLPLPMHGAAKMNEMYFQSKLINKKFETQHIRLNYSKKIKEIGRFNFIKILGIYIVILKLFYKLIFFRPSLVYFEIAPKGGAFIRDSLFVLICKLFRKKILFQFHAKGVDEEIKSKLKLRYYKWVFQNTKVILLSKLLYYDIEKVVQKDNVYFLPNGIEDELTDKEFKAIIKQRKKNKKLILLFLSNMIEFKGPLDALKICNLLNKDKINFECWFVGAWSNEEFKKKWYKLLKKYKLQNKCKYLGPRYGDKKNEILKKANLLLFPTKNECYPLVILEAFMFGIPVLSNNVGAINEIIKKDYLGFVSEKRDWKELYNYLKRNFKKQINAGKIRTYFEKNYRFEIAEKKLMKILEKEL